MTNQDLNWIANYFWVSRTMALGDLCVCGKYRDVVVPMTVLRGLDAVREDSKRASWT